jgi:hypothetical protein
MHEIRRGGGFTKSLNVVIHEKFRLRREKNEKKVWSIVDSVMFNSFFSFRENFFCSGPEAD